MRASLIKCGRSLGRRHERGSMLVEFILVFPTFLILCLFIVEVSLMWADKHIMRLAAFEAARVIASADLPHYDKDGIRHEDPCKAPEILREAYQSAIRRMAIITPPLALYLRKLQTGILSDATLSPPSMPRIPPSSGFGALNRLLQRWPTAVVSTHLQCDYDPKTSMIHMDLRYDRVSPVPLVDRILWMLHVLRNLDAQLNFKVVTHDLDPLYFTVRARLETPAAIAKTKDTIQKSIATMRKLGMGAEQSADFLSGQAGIAHIVGRVPTMPAEIGNFFAATGAEAAQKLAAVTAAYAKVLTAVQLAVPEALRTVPLRTQVKLVRDFYRDGATLDQNGHIREPEWEGLVRGAMQYSDEHRKWGQNLSTMTEYISGGKPL